MQFLNWIKTPHFSIKYNIAQLYGNSLYYWSINDISYNYYALNIFSKTSVVITNYLCHI